MATYFLQKVHLWRMAQTTEGGLMEAALRKIMQAIYDEAIKTQDGFVVSVKIPLDDLNKRQEYCGKLQQRGYIAHICYIGQDKIQCQITPLGLDFINNKSDC